MRSPVPVLSRAVEREEMGFGKGACHEMPMLFEVPGLEAVKEDVMDEIALRIGVNI